jgi:hypothetical protein
MMAMIQEAADSRQYSAGKMLPFASQTLAQLCSVITSYTCALPQTSLPRFTTILEDS